MYHDLARGKLANIHCSAWNYLLGTVLTTPFMLQVAKAYIYEAYVELQEDGETSPELMVIRVLK